MTDVSGIPNMGFGGGGYFGGSAAYGYPAMSADQINASMGYNPNAAQFDPWANSPGGFGGQTDYYSGLGAAYGRETGGFGGGNSIPGGYPSGGVESAPLAPPPYQDPFAGASADTMSPADRWGMGSTFDQSAYNPASDPSYGSTEGYGGGAGGIGSDTSRDPYAWTYAQSSPYAEASAPPSGGSYPNLGYNPGMENMFANPAMGGGFGEQFGQWGQNPGTPSQYTSSPYTNTQGQTFQPNMPAGYAPAFGADQPGGALPLDPRFAQPGGG